MSTPLIHRYPGIRSFQATEQELFSGRSEEIRSLYTQVKVLKLVVLFSKSGIGKSSLLNAGLIPLLELEPFFPLIVRFQDTTLNPVDAAKIAFQPYLDLSLLLRHTGKSFATAGLWECLRACRFDRYGETAVPVLIFDQFEEFFEHTEVSRRSFVADLADIVSDRLPNHMRDQLFAIPVERRSAEDMKWHQPIKAKIVIAIRSDRLSLLDDLSGEIPLILHNRLQIRPFQRNQAREAITAPASLPGAGFVSQPFVYQAPALELILDELTNKNQEIESCQLQLICNNIERQVAQRQNVQSGQPLEIDPSFVGGREGILSVINDYYERSIDALPEEYKETARNFIETGLIVGGRRVGVTEGVEKERYGVQEELLAMLVDSRLVRVENTHLGRSYEISHDALVAPVLSSYEKRLLQMERMATAAAERERRRLVEEQIHEREALLNIERRIRKRSMRFAFIAGVFALIATFAFFIAVNRSQEAEKQSQYAKEQYQETQKAIEKYREAELKLLITQADVFLAANQPLMAKRTLEEAKKRNIWSSEMDIKLAQVDSMLNK